jgi:hypothetical protein
MQPFVLNISHQEQDPEMSYRWSVEKAAEWQRKTGWLVGCNFVPHNAINQLEMWQAETFDPFLIDKELEMGCKSLGFNTDARIPPPPSLGAGQQRLPRAHRPLPFYCPEARHPCHAGAVRRRVGSQPAARQAARSQSTTYTTQAGYSVPGFDVLNNPDRYDTCMNMYMAWSTISSTTTRVVIWDLYNEPDNMNIASYKDDYYVKHKAELSLELLEAKRSAGYVASVPISRSRWRPGRKARDWSSDETVSVLDNYMFARTPTLFLSIAMRIRMA